MVKNSPVYIIVMWGGYVPYLFPLSKQEKLDVRTPSIIKYYDVMYVLNSAAVLQFVFHHIPT